MPGIFWGVAELESQQVAEAKQHLNKCMALNNRHLDALLMLSKIAVLEKNSTELEKMIYLIQPLDKTKADELSIQVMALKSES
jgi:hypothetical protein